MSVPRELASHCVQCQRPIDSSWAFCSYCGADNRPPESRPLPAPHTDMFADGGGFCYVCGSTAFDPESRAKTWSLVAFVVSFTLMLVLTGVGLWFQYGSHTGAQAHLDQIVPGYVVQNNYWTRTSAHYSPPPTIGSQIARWYDLGGGLAFFACLAIASWRSSLFPKSRSRWRPAYGPTFRPWWDRSDDDDS